MRKRLKPDTALKEYWEDNERYADFFNAVLFGGREVIHASQLQERDTEESNILELGDKDESITAARDLFRVLKTAMGVEFALVGMENQDKIHYGMPVRVMNLDAYAYDRQWKSLKQKYKDVKGLTEDEYLSHMRKEDKFLPVVTVVIYYGEKAWDGARDLHGVLNIPDEIKPFVGNYPMHLVEVVNNKLQFNNADNKDLFQLLNLVYNASLDKKERLKKAQEYEDSHIIDEDVVRALAATNNIKVEKTKGKGRLKVCTLFEEIAKDSRTEGRTEEQKRGIRSLVKMCHKFGQSCEIAKNSVIEEYPDVDEKLIDNIVDEVYQLVK